MGQMPTRPDGPITASFEDDFVPVGVPSLRRVREPRVRRRNAPPPPPSPLAKTGELTGRVARYVARKLVGRKGDRTEDKPPTLLPDELLIRSYAGATKGACTPNAGKKGMDRFEGEISEEDEEEEEEEDEDDEDNLQRLTTHGQGESGELTWGDSTHRGTDSGSDGLPGSDIGDNENGPPSILRIGIPTRQGNQNDDAGAMTTRGADSRKSCGFGALLETHTKSETQSKKTATNSTPAHTPVVEKTVLWRRKKRAPSVRFNTEAPSVFHYEASFA